MSQKDTGTTDEDPNDYLDSMDDLYEQVMFFDERDAPADTVMVLLALTIEVRKARQALETIAEKTAVPSVNTSQLRRAVLRAREQITEDTDAAAARADQLDNDLRN